MLLGALAKGVCVEYTMKEMEQATNNWSKANLLGSGGFGDVFKGKQPPSRASHRILLTLTCQVSEMASKHHPNLVRLLGYATCGDLRERIEQILVYEFIPNGDLDKWLSKVGAARGFDYLHGFDIVHRDIKPANILLDTNMQPKVADFGLVRVEGGSTVQATQVMGTPGYVDPAYSHTQKATTATDVYSFGILMLVMLTGRRVTFEADSRSWNILDWQPLPMCFVYLLLCPSTSSHPTSPLIPQHPQVQEKLCEGSVEEIADPRMGPVPPHALQRMADLAVRCCATFTADRPSMGRIAQEMDVLRAEVCGGEEQVHKAYMKVDAELQEKMQYQSQISEDSLNDALASIS
ncbi:unnamed protein product [Closterium sp. NIES-64]|nr:unnamed protein product [Closterium sp. NIES-64]